MLKFSPKILIIVFLSIFIVQLICLIILLTLPQPSHAASINFTPQVGIPGSEFDTGKTYDFSKDASTKPIALYIQAIYKYAIGIVGILAAVVLMVGGVLWIVAGGNASQVSEAKAWIGSALTGLILVLTSYLILNTINPALVNLTITKIPGVKEVPPNGHCIISGLPYDTCENNLTETQCQSKGSITWQKGQLCPKTCCLHGYGTTKPGYKGWLDCTNDLLSKKDCSGLNTNIAYKENMQCADDGSTGGKTCK